MSTFYDQGKYLGAITAQGFSKAQTGTPQFVLRFKVLSHANGDAVPEQYERTVFRSITDKTMQYFKRDLEALGFEGTSLRQLDPNAGNFVDLSGSQCLFTCSHEVAQGGGLRERWGVAWATQESTAIEGDSVDTATFRKLDALFGASRNQESKPPQAARPVANRPAAAATAGKREVVAAYHSESAITDEDIPF